MAFSKIDVHHHIIPPLLASKPLARVTTLTASLLSHNDTDHTEGMRGWKEPGWSFEQDQAFSDDVGIETHIFSVSTPGVSFIKQAK
jgi:hypothetical protein